MGHISLESERILVLDVNDDCVTTATVRGELSQRYPDAKVATLKSGGDFPFLSCAAELALYLEVGGFLWRFCFWGIAFSWDDTAGLRYWLMRGQIIAF